VSEKKEGKIAKYRERGRKLRTIWKARTKVSPVIVGALGVVLTGTAGSFLELGIRVSAERPCKRFLE